MDNREARHWEKIEMQKCRKNPSMLIVGEEKKKWNYIRTPPFVAKEIYHYDRRILLH
jgi:hypothetical protein